MAESKISVHAVRDCVKFAVYNQKWIKLMSDGLTGRVKDLGGFAVDLANAAFAAGVYSDYRYALPRRSV